jgi:hypothetical protein
LAVFRSACSAPAPGRRRRSWPPSASASGSARSCRAGGRPDLAGDILDRIRTPTLLIVGGTDFGVLELNEQGVGAAAGTQGAGNRSGRKPPFSEAGALDAVIGHAARWFERHLRSGMRYRSANVRAGD